jgi:[ribosomal protein S5]-alanine N-acetyltransferase
MINIRAINNTDLEFLTKLRSNEEVRKYLGGIVSVEEIKISFDNMLNSKNLYYIISDDSFNKIGLISLDLYHDKIHKELSYEFLPDFWNKGYAYFALKLFLENINNTEEIDCILAETQSKNDRSVKLLEKIGFIKISTIIRFGEEQSVYKYEIKKFG